MSAQESDLYELSMSEESQPLMAAVKKHIEENFMFEQHTEMNSKFWP